MLPCIEEYVNYLAVEKGLSENTLMSYVNDLQKYEKFTISDVKKSHAQRYI